MQATGHNFYNQAHANKRAIEVALDALRKIRLGHPCDVPEAIAKYAVEEIEEIINQKREAVAIDVRDQQLARRMGAEFVSHDYDEGHTP